MRRLAQGAVALLARLRADPAVSRFLSHYGMLLALIALCAFFSLATLEEQHPAGAEAAGELAEELDASFGEPATVLVAARESREDGAFADALVELLEERGGLTVAAVRGDPVALRRAMEGAALGGRVPNVIATTKSYEPVVANIRKQFPALAASRIVVPPSYTWPTFLLAGNLLNVANQIVVIAVVAVGMTMVIITGGIDLSVGSLVALSAVVAAWLIGRAGGTAASGFMMLVCCLGAVAACAAVGAFSGAVITGFQVPPFIATLSMMMVARGLAYIVSKGKPIYRVPDSFVWLGWGKLPLLGIPYAVILMVLIYAVAHVVMSRTTLGRYVYAVGGNREAARLSGVRVDRVLLIVYMTCGAMAGLGGIVLASQLKGGGPTYAQMYELYVIASVVVGGTSLSGGEGKIMGTFIGAFIIAVIQNGMNLTNVESYTQMVVLGFVILGAVLVDRLRKRVNVRPARPRAGTGRAGGGAGTFDKLSARVLSASKGAGTPESAE